MGIFDFFKKKESPTPTKLEMSQEPAPIDEFTQEMVDLANFFVERHESRFPGLDFSVDSLAVVDELLEEASDVYEDLDEDHQDNLIRSVGSYIFEVARRNFGGQYHWYEKLDQPIFVTGQPAFEVSLLAFEKVKGRLENGLEDQIPFYFQGYIERVKNKQSGMVV